MAAKPEKVVRRIVVTGSRDWPDEEYLRHVLDQHLPHLQRLAHGNCPTGADAMADAWARDRGVPVTRYAADWKQYGKSAGPRRNEQMIVAEQPDLVVAFQIHGSAGTQSCVNIAQANHITVERHTNDGARSCDEHGRGMPPVAKQQTLDQLLHPK